MSRIHEAVRKAVLEQQPEAASTMGSVESILSTSYTITAATPKGLAGAGVPDRRLPGPDLFESLPTTDWMPDKKRMLFYSENADAPGREQFRSLRIKLYQLREMRDLSVIAIASSLSGEGKSFVAANLAHSLSLQRERRALIIDCDLRRGSIAGFLGARPGPGLAEYLLGQEPLEAVIQRGNGGNLYLMPSGLRISDPGEMIGSSLLRETLSRLRPLFDWIVIDTPPAVQFADTGVIADLCDGLLLVLGAGRTPIQIAKQAIDGLREDRILGIVLNRAEDSDQTTKYFNYYKDPEG